LLRECMLFWLRLGKPLGEDGFNAKLLRMWERAILCCKPYILRDLS
jgi:hypothetical protein